MLTPCTPLQTISVACSAIKVFRNMSLVHHNHRTKLSTPACHVFCAPSRCLGLADEHPPWLVQIGDPSRGWEAAYTVTTAAAIGNTSRTASGNIAAPGSSNASPSSSAQTNLASPMPQGSAGASQGQHGRSAADGDGGQPGAGPQLQTPQVSADLEGPNREGAGEQARAEASGGVLDRLTSRPRASLTALSAALGRIGRYQPRLCLEWLCCAGRAICGSTEGSHMVLHDV